MDRHVQLGNTVPKKEDAKFGIMKLLSVNDRDKFVSISDMPT